MATEFEKKSRDKIAKSTPATLEFERVKEEASIEAAAARIGKSPEEIKALAKAAGTDPISWIKDNAPLPGSQKKPAERAPAEPRADKIVRPPGYLEDIQRRVQSPGYDPVKNMAEALDVPPPPLKTAAETLKKKAPKPPASGGLDSTREVTPTVPRPKKEAPVVQEVAPTPSVAEQVKRGAALNKEQAAIRGTITSAPQFAIITAENPRGETVPGGNEALKKELSAKGYKFEQMEGMYEGKENPFLVQTDKLSDIQSLGKRYGQESVILADNNKYKMQFTSGPKEGQFYTANTITQYATPPKDYYSTVIRDGKPVHFSMDFDMEKLKGKPAPPVPAKAIGPALPPLPTSAENAAQAERKEPLRKLKSLFQEAGQSPDEAVKSAEKVLPHMEEVAAKSGIGIEKTIKTSVLDALKKNPKTALAGVLLAAAAAYKLSPGDGDKTPPRPVTPPPTPTPTPTPVPTPDKEKTPIDKIEAKLSPFEEYKKKLVLTPTETADFAAKETKLTDRLDTARKEYREGNRTTEFMMMLDKLAEAATLIGAGLYGKKHGVDAVSGLKFNPINWETRIKRLDKELDLEEKSYTKATGVLEKDKESMLAEKKAAVTYDEASVQAAQKMLAATIAAGTRKEEKSSTEAGRQSDRQVKRIESAISDIEKVRGMADDKMQSAAEALATTLRIPESDLLKKGFWGGSSFNATVAKEALGSLQKKLVAQKDEILSGGRGAAPPSAGGVRTEAEELRLRELKQKRGVK